MLLRMFLIIGSIIHKFESFFCRGDVAKPEIYHPKESQAAKEADTHLTEDNSISPGKESLLVKDETFPELAPGRSSTEVSFLRFRMFPFVSFHEFR